MTGWKTILVAVLSGLVYLLGWEQLTEYVDPQVIAILMSIAMAVLRFLTGTKIFNKA